MKLLKYTFLLAASAMLFTGCDDDDDDNMKIDPVTISFDQEIIEVEEASIEASNVIITFDKETTFDFQFSVNISASNGVTYGKDFITIPAAVNNVVTVMTNEGQRAAFFKVVSVDNQAFNNDASATLEEKLRKNISFTLASDNSDVIVGADNKMSVVVLEDDIPGLVDFATAVDTANEDDGTYEVKMVFSTEVTKASSLRVFVTSTNGTFGVLPTDNFNAIPAPEGNYVTVAVQPGATEASFTLVINDNNVLDDSKNLKFTLLDAVDGITIGNEVPVLALTVLNDDM